jgi:hypothetical protein
MHRHDGPLLQEAHFFTRIKQFFVTPAIILAFKILLRLTDIQTSRALLLHHFVSQKVLDEVELILEQLKWLLDACLKPSQLFPGLVQFYS